ncbi:MAG: thioether cross-link-forming SCIFF peptide maturase [Clostridiales bacterium]|jgi:uncharacterized protein|nr:thioether cross-link-forming SCIFF peptide maturase [Clostridiales bacterium]
MQNTLDFSRVHQFFCNGDHLILDINSGSLHLLDPKSASFLTWLQNKNISFPEAADLYLKEQPQKTALQEIFREIEELIAQELLFSPPLPIPDKLPKTWIKSLCLNICHDCNLRCKYCFAGTGNFGGRRLLMPLETARQAIDLLLKESGPRPFCELDFFGGEPLLNFKVVQEAYYYGKEAAKKAGKQLKFTLTTNGYALDEATLSWLNQENISLVLSHDGRPRIHDAMRRLPDGSGSHAKVEANLNKAAASRPNGNYFIRGTYSSNNLDFVEDIHFWLDQGYQYLSLEPAIAENQAAWRLTEEHLPRLGREYQDLARLCYQRFAEGRPFNFFHFNLDLTKAPCLAKRLWGCGAGYEYIAVTPEGDIYPCHQFVGNEAFILGNVTTGIKNNQLGKEFKAAHIYNKPACRNCWARYFCSCGCHANNYNAHGNLLIPHQMSCDLFKIRLEAGLWLNSRICMHI